MLDLLAVEVGHELEPARLTVPSGARVEVDGADADRRILVECWAHQGPPKAAQRHKVLADAFKLTWIATTIYPRPRLILCLSDEQAAAPFLPTSRSWAAQALQDLGIVVTVVHLPDEVRLCIQERRSGSTDDGMTAMTAMTERWLTGAARLRSEAGKKVEQSRE